MIVVGARRAATGSCASARGCRTTPPRCCCVASFIIVLIGLATRRTIAASHHIKTISIIGAVAILIVYGGLAAASTSAPTRRLAWSSTVADRRWRSALVLLAVAGGASAFVSDWFVHALQPTIDTLHISQAFAGLVIVAIAGNAVENVAGIVLAYKGNSELAISVVKNSVAQIAAFLYPLLVLVSLLTATTLTFALAPVYIGALLG